MFPAIGTRCMLNREAWIKKALQPCGRKKKKIERNVSRFRTTIEPKNTWNSRIFSVQNINLLLFKIKGIRSYDARAYSSFVLSVFFVFKLTPTRISSIVKKFIDKQVKCFCYYRWIQDSANRWYRKISFNTQDGKTIKIEIIFLFRALTINSPLTEEKWCIGI